MNDNEPIRILHCVNDLHRAGLETMIMNYYRKIDRTKIQFDFLTHRPYKSDYDDEIIRMGGRVFYAPRLYPKNYIKYFKWMKKFFNEHKEYKIIHSHIDSMSFFPLFAAKKNNVPIRIAHSHSTSIDRDYKYFLKQIFRYFLPKVSTLNIACGQKAGEFLFRKNKFTILPNAIDAKKYKFNSELRNLKRSDMHITDDILIGHVGRFCEVKNHKFLIDVFEKIHTLNSKTKLILIGTGELEERIKKYVDSKNINNYVYFLGNRSDVSDFYQAMDIFVLPSLFEGIPLVGIEAQFSNLPVIFSDRVPAESKISENTIFIPLEDGINNWANRILEIKNIDRNKYSFDMMISEFNIDNTLKKLVDIYYKMLKENSK